MDLSPPDWKYVEERAAAFVGREWVFARVRSFLSGPSGAFVLRGDPGTGKTAVAGRIAQASSGRATTGDLRAQAAVAEGTISAGVFCQAGKATVAELVQRLSRQLANSVEGFAGALQSTVAPEIRVENVHVQARDVVGDVTGVRIDLSGLSGKKAFDAGLAVPLRHLRELGSVQQIVLLVDGVDEAASAGEVNVFSRELARLDGVHLIVTCRPDPPVLFDFREAEHKVDLVANAPPDDHDARDYIRNRLEGHGSEAAIGALIGRVTEAAAGNFLYAFYVTGTLIRSGSLVGIDEERANSLPLPTSGLAGVYEDFLDRQIAGDETRWAGELRPVLASLCVALGDGFTTVQLAAIASRLTGRDFSLTKAGDVARAARQFFDGPDPDGPFRLYHQSFARFLTDREQNPNWPIDLTETGKAIVDALRDEVPKGQREEKDWAAADPYTRKYLAVHAAATRCLDDLLMDAGYLLAADQGQLLPVLSSVHTTAGRAIANVVRRASQYLLERSPEEAASYLEMGARQSGLDTLAAQFAELGLKRPWTTVWALWRRPQQRQRLAPNEHITAMALCDLRGEHVAVLATKRGELQVCRLTDGSIARRPIIAQDPQVIDLDLYDAQIRILAAGEIDEHPVVVAIDGFRHIRAWDLLEESSTPIWWLDQDRGVVAVVVTEVIGVPVVVSANGRMVSFRRPSDGTLLDDPYRLDTEVRALVVTQLNSEPVMAVNDDVEERVGIWELSDASQAGNVTPSWCPDYGESIGPRHHVTSLAVLTVLGRSIAVSGDDAGYVWIWDLGDVGGDSNTPPIGRHQNPNFPNVRLEVSAVAINQVNSQLIAASGDPWGRTQVWDVVDKRRIADFDTGHTAEIRSLAITDLNNEPVVVSHADDGIARVWDLNEGSDASSAAVGKVSALAFADLVGASVLLVGGMDGTVRILRVADGLLAAPVFRDHSGEVTALAAGTIGDQPVVLSAGIDGTVRVWDPTNGKSMGQPYSEHNAIVTALAVTELDGSLIAASGGHDKMVRVWDAVNRAPLGKLISLGGAVPLGGVAFAELGPRPIIITGSDNMTGSVAQAWDLLDRNLIGHPVTLDDTMPFGAVTSLQLGSEPLVVFSDYHGVVRLRGFTDKTIDTDLHCSLPLWSRGIAATFSEGQPIVMAGSREGGVLDIWTVHSGKQQRIDIGSSILALAARSDRLLAVGTEDGVTLIKTARPDEPSASQSRARR